MKLRMRAEPSQAYDVFHAVSIDYQGDHHVDQTRSY
ncbi:hypothetical protein FNL37_0048 [Methylovorus glucosotrophus]|nr:hypothetical protein FNL37_0048 [Methylovorus glucosotrophus]